MLLNYFARLPNSKLVLWCYLIWYLCVVSLHFTPAPAIWLNSLGLSIFVGYALFLSTGPATLTRLKLRFWESLRLFVCPFLVSSFSALVKGKGFILLLAPTLHDNLLPVIACTAFIITVKSLGWIQRKGLTDRACTIQ